MDIRRVATAMLMIVAALLTYALRTAKEAFDLILSIGAGTGLIYLLRWFLVASATMSGRRTRRFAVRNACRV